MWLALITLLHLFGSAGALHCTPSARPAAARRVASSPLMAGVSKAELVDAIAAKAGVSPKTTSLVLAATLDVIMESVSEENKVSLIGFGTFSSKERAQREVRNPKTGEKLTVPAALVPAFSFSKSFKEVVKEAGRKRGI